MKIGRPLFVSYFSSLLIDLLESKPKLGEDQISANSYLEVSRYIEDHQIGMGSISGNNEAFGSLNSTIGINKEPWRQKFYILDRHSPT